jgi:hypothetical protein
MRRTLISYKAKPEMADRNAELVAAVFAELKAAQPDGVHYLTLRLDDGTFVHLVGSAAEDGSSPDHEARRVPGLPGRYPRPLRRAAIAA